MSKTRIKLSSYSGHRKYDRQSATLIDNMDGIALIQFCDEVPISLPSDLIIPVNVKKYTLTEYSQIVKVGDWVRTNGDGNIKEVITLEGQVGEIGNYYDEINQTEKSALFIWQNRFPGNSGKKNQIKKGFDYSWMVFLDNKDAFIELITGKDNSPKVKCSCCEKEVELFDLDLINKKRICVTCLQNLYTKCDECGSFIEKDKLILQDGKLYCSSCHKKVYIECSCCKVIVYKDQIKIGKKDKKYYCANCYSQLFTSCGGCKLEMFKKDNLHRQGIDGSYYCKPCFNERFGTCDKCGNYQYHDDLRIDEDTGKKYCLNCWRQIAPIKDYRFVPKYEFQKFAWENTLFLGFELEIDTPPNILPEQVAIRFSNFLKKEGINDYMYFKHDGSIKGFELVTHPLTLQFMHKNLKMKTWLSWLASNNCTSYDNEHCGLHIHVNKKFFKVLDVVKLRLFIKNNWEPVVKFSQRNGIGMSYCSPDPASVKEILGCRAQQGRYWALNLNTGDKQTIEFRIFRGTLRHERLIATMQFIDAICHFVKTIGITSLYNEKIKKDSWAPFLEWCQKSNRYDHLVKLIKRGKLR